MSGGETKTDIFTITEMGEPAADADTCRTDKTRRMYEQYVQPCLAELLGTALFVYVGCGSVIGNVGALGVIQPALAHGLALGVLIAVLGQISGGHFNPAVSLTVYLCGEIKLLLGIAYTLAQMLGGMIGAGLAKAVYPPASYVASLGGALQPNTNELIRCIVAEVLMTLMLTMVVFMGAANGQTRSPLAPLCIGLTVTANIFTGGMLSGACMNPARAFGPAVAANHWNNHWVYWFGPLCGALLSVLFIRLFFGDRNTRVVLK